MKLTAKEFWDNFSTKDYKKMVLSGNYEYDLTDGMIFYISLIEDEI